MVESKNNDGSIGPIAAVGPRNRHDRKEATAGLEESWILMLSGRNTHGAGLYARSLIRR